MIDSPKIVHSTELLTAIIPLTIPKDQIRTAMGPGIMELMSTVAAQNAGPTGPWFTHHLKMDPAFWDFEISVPVSKPITPIGRVRAGRLPAVKVARTVYHGGYEGLGAAWGEFLKWIEANGHTSAPNLWEVYVAGPESGSDSSKWQTELNQPLTG